MTEGTYIWRPDKVPTIGKDHLVLADYRLSVSKRNSVSIVTDPANQDQESFCGLVAFESQREDGTPQQVVHESGAITPFPNTKDDVVIVAMITLSHMAGHPEKLLFDIPHVISLLGWTQDTFYRDKVKKALTRTKAMTTRFDGVWFDRKDRSCRSYDSGIIGEFSTTPQPGRPAVDRRLSSLQWTPAFRQSLLNGNLLNIELPLLTSFSSHAGTQYFRHLNKVWHSGKKPFYYERDLEELAYDQLQLGQSAWMKRNFTEMLDEHVEKGTVLQATDQERFLYVEKRWRVGVRPGPAWQTKRTCGAKYSEPHKLVTAYHRKRHGVQSHQPIKNELSCAKRLLAEFSLDDLLAAISEIVKRLKSASGDDVYFHYAEALFRQQLAKQDRKSSETARMSEPNDQQVREAKRERRARYQALSDKKKQSLFQSVQAKTSSATLLQELQKMNLERPPAAVLQEMELTMAQPIGD